MNFFLAQIVADQVFEAKTLLNATRLSLENGSPETALILLKQIEDLLNQS